MREKIEKDLKRVTSVKSKKRISKVDYNKKSKPVK